MVLKDMILTVFSLAGCHGLEKTDFNSFYLKEVWWSSNR